MRGSRDDRDAREVKSSKTENPTWGCVLTRFPAGSRAVAYVAVVARNQIVPMLFA